MIKYLTLFGLLLLVSCASKEKPEEKIYSDDTNRAFDMIERGGSYYLKNPAPAKPAPQVIKRSRPASSTPPKVKVDERLIEINQNLAFYCMKHRKDPMFSGSEEKCMSYVNKNLEKCQAQHKSANKKLLSCIQNKLKRR